MVNTGNGIFDYTSNVSGKADVNVGEDTGSEYQNAPISELRRLIMNIQPLSGSAAIATFSGMVSGIQNYITSGAAIAAASGMVSGIQNYITSGVVSTNFMTSGFITTNYQTSGTFVQNAIPMSYYVFQASGGYYARSSMSGHIEFSDPNSVDPVMSGCISAMTSGLTQDKVFQTWSGSYGGVIGVGPGTFSIKSAIILRSFININGMGPMSTVFQWASGLILNNPNQIMFKSSTWDALNAAASGGPAGGTATPNDVAGGNNLLGGDEQVILRDFQIDGGLATVSGKLNSANVITTTFSGGVFGAGISGTYGHGIAWYGISLLAENLLIKNCPGAGLIHQWYFGDTAYNSNPANPAQYRDGAIVPECRLNRIWTIRNGLEGLLMRSTSYATDIMSYQNGEAGISKQMCKSFGGQIRMQGFDTFLNGANYSGSSYNIRSLELFLAGDAYIWDGVVEGSQCGDSIWVGGPAVGQVGLGNSGYILSSASDIRMWDVQIDSCKAVGILIHGNNNYIRDIEFIGTQGAPANSGAVGYKILGNSNVLDVQSMLSNGSGNITLQLGQDSGDPYQYGGVSGTYVRGVNNIVKLQALSETNAIQWASGSIRNHIQAQLQLDANTNAIISGLINVDLTRNDVYIQGGSGLGAGLFNAGFGITLQSASGYGLNFTSFISGNSATTTASTSGAYTPLGYIFINISGGTAVKVPYFNS